MIDKTLREYALPAELIISDFVQNEPDCNCEKYMLELINKSSFFLGKSGGQQYTKPLRENNGECDFNSDSYMMDLKLIGAQSHMDATSNLSPRKAKIAVGVWCTTMSKGHKDDTAGRIHALLRNRNMVDLVQIRQKEKGRSKEEKDLNSFLKKLETKKNLLLFFPYELRFDSKYEFHGGIERIQDAINDDFSTAMKYRKKVQPEYDTYFALLYDGKMVFLENQLGNLLFVDCVNLSESPIFMKLASYADWI